MSEALLLVGESTSNQNLFYKTRFLAGDPFLYVEHGNNAMLIVPAMELGRARNESPVTDVRATSDFGYVDLYRQHGDPRRALAHVARRALEEYGAETVRVEPALPLLLGDTLRELGLRLQIDADMIVEQRRSKSEDEITAIGAVQATTERALAHAITLIEASEEHGGLLHFNGIPLTSERVRAEIETELLRANLMCDMDSIVAGGPSGADPHERGVGPLKWGEPIVMDIFPRDRSSRYYGDITRTVVQGEPSDATRAMYEAVMEAHAAALSLVRAGANGADIHRAVQEVLRRAGYDGRADRPSMPHGTGHGIGLDIHEAPRLGEIDIDLLEHEVITIEPGLYHPQFGGVRVEDAVVVTRDGYRNLTTLSKRFELGSARIN